MYNRLIVIVLSVVVCSADLAAQLVDYAGKVVCPMPDGEDVVLLPSTETPHAYYCLPSHLRLSVNEDKQPEFLLMLWGAEEGQGVDNGIMHWLLTWGLTQDQEKQVNAFLVGKVDSSAVLLGVMSVFAPEKYVLKGKNSDMIRLLQSSVTSGGGIPTVPGGKSATSFKFKAKEAATIYDYALKPEKWKEVIIEMPFYGLQNEPLCTLTIDASGILTAAQKCESCFLLPGK